MYAERKISTVSKDLNIADYNLIGVIKILNKNKLTDIEIDQNEQVITGTEQDIVTLYFVAGNILPHGYERTFTKTFMHIDTALKLMRTTKNKLIESYDQLEAVGLQDYYIDDAGNITMIQFQSKGSFQNQTQQHSKQDKATRPNKARRPKRRKRQK